MQITAILSIQTCLRRCFYKYSVVHRSTTQCSGLHGVNLQGSAVAMCQHCEFLFELLNQQVKSGKCSIFRATAVRSDNCVQYFLLRVSELGRGGENRDVVFFVCFGRQKAGKKCRFMEKKLTKARGEKFVK